MVTHTSGTTGVPKGVMLTHGNVTWNVVNLLSIADFRDDDVTIAVAPFFRTGGTGVNVLPVLFKGGSVVIPEAGDPDEILDLIERWHVTVGFGNPDLLERSPGHRAGTPRTFPAIRVFMTGGAPVPEHLIRAYMERGVTFLQGYGLSEAAPLVLLLDPQSASAQGRLGWQAAPLRRRSCHPTRRNSVRSERDGRAARQRPERDDRLLGPSGRDSGDDRRVRMAPHRRRRADRRRGIRLDRRSRRRRVRRVRPRRVSGRHRARPRASPCRDRRRRGRDDGEGSAFVVLAPGVDVTEAELLEFSRAELEPYEVPRSITFLDRLPRNSVGKLLRHDLLRATRSDASDPVHLVT